MYVLRLGAEIDRVAKFWWHAAISLGDDVAMWRSDVDQRLVAEWFAYITY